MKFKINLINIGREKINQEYEQDADDLDEIANLTYVKVKRFLLSSDVCLDPDENDKELWKLYAGFHKVGEVRIKEIKKLTIKKLVEVSND